MARDSSEKFRPSPALTKRFSQQTTQWKARLSPNIDAIDTGISRPTRHERGHLNDQPPDAAVAHKKIGASSHSEKWNPSALDPSNDVHDFQNG
jgi:hypothetical protein